MCTCHEGVGPPPCDDQSDVAHLYMDELFLVLKHLPSSESMSACTRFTAVNVRKMAHSQQAAVVSRNFCCCCCYCRCRCCWLWPCHICSPHHSVHGGVWQYHVPDGVVLQPGVHRVLGCGISVGGCGISVCDCHISQHIHVLFIICFTSCKLNL